MTIASPEAKRSRRHVRPASRERLRLWLRILRASRGMETELRERLRITHGMTLPQFDVLAALARRGEITMTELSRQLMVSNGNVTGIIDRLVEDGWVERAARPGDRRSTLVRLTPKGTEDFAAMAAEHETWVDELLGRFSRTDTLRMIAELDGLVAELRSRDAESRKGSNRR
jgi:DNA-binding MarR family transcriptional regulator